MKTAGAALLLLVLLWGCSAPHVRQRHTELGTQPPWFPSERCQVVSPPDRSACYKDWTVLVYMAADNDLIPYAQLNLYELEAQEPGGGGRSASTERTDVVVQLDTPGPRGLRRLHMLPVGERYDDALTLTELAARPEAALKSPLVAQLPEGGSPEADLRSFLSWGVRSYPAQHYMIVAWGHGQGWAAAQSPPLGPGADRVRSLPLLANVPQPADDPFAGRFRGGVLFDWSPPGFVDIPALHAALKEVKTTLGRPIDVYALDACLMQTVEVATELRDTARFVVSSAYLQDFVGLPYRALLGVLNDPGPGSAGAGADPARQVAALLPELYMESLDPGRNKLRGRLAAELRKRFTLSALSTDALGRELLPALAELGTALVDYITEDALRIGDVQYIFREQTGLYGSIQDLGAFLGALQAQLAQRAKQGVAQGPVSERLQQAVLRAQEALTRTVIAYRFGTDYAADGQAALGLRAVSVWLPVTESDFRTRIADYKTAELYKYRPPGQSAEPNQDVEPQSAGPWQRFITALYPNPPSP